MAVRPHDVGLEALVVPTITDLGASPSDPALSSAYWQQVWNQQQALIV